MFGQSQTSLHTHRPTPTTASFTVSTRSSKSKAFLTYVSLILRLICGLFVILVVWTKCQTFGMGIRAWLPTLGRFAQLEVPSRLPWRYLLPGACAVIWTVSRRGYTEESLLVLRGLGMQVSSSSAAYLSAPVTRFIPTTSIQDIFIHEAFKGFEVRFYLAIVVEGEEDTVVVFPNLLPKRQILEEVWRGAKACLYEPKS
ncbi:hypothetical protein K402DRAFT_396810 [Aulographum hederae CBS 113979]|uniref:Phosphatidylinositol N-acetylglucosaminyltransferase subunit H conserved domain-containing protein n=1 Tax=Aulographum hederae CBS 113979 TaxID=1176131 RepID=A0A6G1GQU1_9PEZI|nr:hypothetical protein K402DRAFT_396810 [Aulographum hederae CBS 113979]